MFIGLNFSPAVNCGSFPGLANGGFQLKPPHATAAFQSVADAVCNPGHSYSSSPATITCLSTGLWSSAGSCTSK